MTRKIIVALAVVAGIAASPALAQYPDRPVKLIVPFAAGGPTDALARNLAEGLRIHLSKQVVIENKAGAGANIGAEFVANSPADGYTLLFGTSGPLAINVSLFGKINYDPAKSFDPVIMIGKIPNVLAVNPEVPVKSLTELIAYAKSGKKLSYGSSGVGASTHLAGELLNSRVGIDLLHVPYRGAAPAMNDVIGGQIPLIITDAFVASSQIKAGTIRPIGVTTMERTALLPDVPTFDEQGLKGFDSSVFFGVVVPKGTPPEIVATLNRAFVAALKEPAVKSAIDTQGMILAPSTKTEYLAEFMAAEIPRSRELIEKLGIPKQ
ncbi:Bug family tripartite tricarboxylate transporter substrate binding protein [Tardiphaga sp. 803_E3_N1_3]|uniref:Bug family tripartite tricarboxylate transporter substrate binding protein n=1 Tax=Tardiphaga sp. 803_E3_N1_3 TaxID=3240785 RepID=UPI003F26C32B